MKETQNRFQVARAFTWQFISFKSVPNRFQTYFQTCLGLLSHGGQTDWNRFQIALKVSCEPSDSSTYLVAKMFMKVKVLWGCTSEPQVVLIWLNSEHIHRISSVHAKWQWIGLLWFGYHNLLSSRSNCLWRDWIICDIG